MTASILVVWALCGIVSYGLSVGYLQGEWPESAYANRRSDRIGAAIFALFGIVALCGVLVLCRPYRWKW